MKVIRMMGQFQDIETIRIFNSDGVIMHSAEAGEMGKEVDELAYNVFQSPDRSKPFRSEEGGHRSFCMVEVMYNEPSCHTCHDPQKEIIGVLEVCLSMAKTENADRRERPLHDPLHGGHGAAGHRRDQPVHVLHDRTAR